MKNKNFIPKRGQFKILSKGKVPSRKEVLSFIQTTIEFLFPILTEENNKHKELDFPEIKLLLEKILLSYETKLNDINDILDAFEKAIPDVYELLLTDAQAIFDGDPAASSIEEVIISYPGFYSLIVYRVAHALDQLSIPIIPRMLTEYSHSKTGIDINPRAIIGKSFCIDHGTGIVIGESTEIGQGVKIYQGVTLGAISVSKAKAGKKRHPSIEDDVTIYAGSTILGGQTIIGHNSVIGGNVWLTHSIDPNSLVVNNNSIRLMNNNPDNPNLIDYVI